MSEWCDGYRAALADVGRLAPSRGRGLWLTARELNELLADLEGDALVIEREQANRIRRRRLALAREELANESLPLFDEPPP